MIEIPGTVPVHQEQLAAPAAPATTGTHEKLSGPVRSFAPVKPGVSPMLASAFAAQPPGNHFDNMLNVIDTFEGRSVSPTGQIGFGQINQGDLNYWRKVAPNYPIPTSIGEYAKMPTEKARALWRDVVLPQVYIPRLTQYGLPVNAQTVEVVNMLGIGGGPDFLRRGLQHPNEPAVKFALPSAVSANRNVFYDKATKRPRTVVELLDYINQKGNGTPQNDYNTHQTTMMANDGSQMGGEIGMLSSLSPGLVQALLGQMANAAAYRQTMVNNDAS